LTTGGCGDEKSEAYQEVGPLRCEECGLAVTGPLKAEALELTDYWMISFALVNELEDA